VAASSVMDDYLAELAARLPASIVDELSDGLGQAYLRYQSAGLSDAQSARAAVRDFGTADAVVASFVAASPARQSSRLLVATGPLVGACWAVVLLAGRAWTWPVPALGRAAFGVLLIAVISTLLVAVAGREYRPTGRAAAAGCLGLIGLDLVLLITVAAAADLPPGLLALGACASGGRLALTLHSLPRMLGSQR
jgi:hypothetical protein